MTPDNAWRGDSLAAEGQTPKTHRLQGDETFATPLPETGRLTLDTGAPGSASCGRALLVFGP